MSFAQEPLTAKTDSRINFGNAQPEDITNENFPDIVESFDYQDADLVEVVKAVSKLTGKNFILDNNVRGGKITILAPSKITVAEAYKAFLSALAMNGFTVVPSGKFLKIRTTRTAQAESVEIYGGAYYPNTDQVITRIIKLKYISAEEITKNLRGLHTKEGRLDPYPPTNSLIMTDLGSNVERVVNILKHLDVPGFEEKLSVIKVTNAKSADIAELVNKIINKGKTSSVPRFGNRNNTTATRAGAESFSFVASDDRTNSIIVVGNSAGISKIRKLVSQVDTPFDAGNNGGVYVYYVKHGEAAQIAEVLNGVAEEAQRAQEDVDAPPGGFPRRNTFTRDRDNNDANSSSSDAGVSVFGGDVKIAADESTNSLIITASRQDYTVVKTLLSKIDMARDQVYIKAHIVEMSMTRASQWGVDIYKFDKDTGGIGRIGIRTSQSATDLLNLNGDRGGILGFGAGDTFNLTAPGFDGTTVKDILGFIRVLRSNSSINVLSTPQIMSVNNEEAEIEVGQDIPVSTQSTSTAAGITTSTDRQQATTKLTITPFISPNSEQIRLKIDQQVRAPNIRTSLSTAGAPAGIAIDERNIKTTILVNHNDTAVLGGLVQTNTSDTVDKIPLLGDIPLLGWLFKAKTTNVEKTNLVVFITPQIIRNTSQNTNLTQKVIDDRIDFIKNHMRGRDPFGDTIDGLPRYGANFGSDSLGTDSDDFNLVDEAPGIVNEPSVDFNDPLDSSTENFNNDFFENEQSIESELDNF